MENNNYQLIKNLCERENFMEKEVIEMLSLAIRDACSQKISGELQITFEPKEKQFLAYQIYQIVDQVKDPDKEISAENELLQSKKSFCQQGRLFKPLNLKKIVNYEEILQNFRLSLQKSRQKKWAEEFLPLQGKIIEGTVQEVYPNYCLVNLLGGKGLGYWGKNEWLSYKSPKIGQQRRFLVKEVKEEGEHTINLVCRDEAFLRKLLEIEIYEIEKGKIIVRDILRCPGIISKVIVFSKDPNINAKSTCIGKEGKRAKIIRQEMESERIEFAEWKENKNELVAELLLPANALFLCKLQGKEGLIVIVRPEQKSLILSLKGKIIQLIEDYLKIKLQILTWEEIEKKNVIIIEDWTNTKNQFNSHLYGPK